MGDGPPGARRERLGLPVLQHLGQGPRPHRRQREYAGADQLSAAARAALVVVAELERLLDAGI